MIEFGSDPLIAGSNSKKLSPYFIGTRGSSCNIPLIQKNWSSVTSCVHFYTEAAPFLYHCCTKLLGLRTHWSDVRGPTSPLIIAKRVHKCSRAHLLVRKCSTAHCCMLHLQKVCCPENKEGLDLLFLIYINLYTHTHTQNC